LYTFLTLLVELSSRATMNMVCRSIRGPVPIDLERVQKLLYSSRPKHHYSDEVNRLEAVLSNRAAATITTAFVSKMVAVEESQLPKEAARRPAELSAQDQARKRQELLSRRRAEGKDIAPVRDDNPHADGAKLVTKAKDGILLAAEQPTVFLLPANYGREPTAQPDGGAGADDAGTAQGTTENADTHVMIAITRVFSGMLRQGQKIWILGAKYDPAVPEEHATEATIEKLFILMGRDFVTVAEAPAGAIVGIQGLAPNVLKVGGRVRACMRACVLCARAESERAVVPKVPTPNLFLGEDFFCRTVIAVPIIPISRA